MFLEEEIIVTVLTLLTIGIVVGLIIVLVAHVIEWYNESSSYIANRTNEMRLDEMYSDELKKHNIHYDGNKPKQKGDFDVDFNVNIGGSIVKTEVVYAD